MSKPYLYAFWRTFDLLKEILVRGTHTYVPHCTPSPNHELLLLQSMSSQ